MISTLILLAAALGFIGLLVVFAIGADQTVRDVARAWERGEI